MRSISILSLLVCGLLTAHAVTSVDLNITLTINHEVAIAWSNDAGDSTQTTNESWVLGTVALDTVYDTPSNDGTPPTLVDLKNTSRTGLTQDVNVSVVNSANWSVGAARGLNTFTVRVRDDGATWEDASSGITDFITGITAGSVSPGGGNDIEYELGTPSSLSAGVGAGQTIIVRFTAEAQ